MVGALAPRWVCSEWPLKIAIKQNTFQYRACLCCQADFSQRLHRTLCVCVLLCWTKSTPPTEFRALKMQCSQIKSKHWSDSFLFLQGKQSAPTPAHIRHILLQHSSLYYTFLEVWQGLSPLWIMEPLPSQTAFWEGINRIWSHTSRSNRGKPHLEAARLHGQKMEASVQSGFVSPVL